MHETAFSFSQLESPAPGATLPPGRHLLRGWVMPKPGGHFVDVRARIHGRIFPGIHGRPRADLAAHFHTRRAVAFAEFYVTVELPLGAVDAELEVLTLEGEWVAFDRVSFRTVGKSAHTLPPPVAHVLRWHDFTRSLDLLLRTRRIRPGVSWHVLAEELADELPPIHDLLPPPLPFVGYADEPSVVSASRFGLIGMVGFLFHTSEKIQRLWATADLQALLPLKLGRATPNLISQFPKHPVAGVSGYEGYVDVPAQLPNPLSVRIYAETASGGLQLAQVRTTRRHDSELEKYPYVGGTAAEFMAAETTWRDTLKARKIGYIDDADLRSALERLRKAFTRVPGSGFLPQTARSSVQATVSAVRIPARVVLATHNLNLEGAPLFFLDLARHLAAGGAALTVVSPSDGPLRESFAGCGARVIILDAGPVFRAQSAAEAQAALTALGRTFDFAAADLVIGNTFTTFWAVHAAKAAGRRVLYYVHESTSPANFYRESVSPAVLALIEQGLAVADAVSFTSAATRHYHAGSGQAISAVLTPGWVDVAAIDRWRADNPRETLRAKFGLKPGELLVTNVGTVCDRKGQIGFCRAVDLFRQRFPGLNARTRFILLGGRATLIDDMLRDVLDDLAIPNLAVHPETPDFLPYYAAADLTVCSSYEESSPRVVMEAMACGTPLLASDIAGIRELARDGLEASLVPAGHTTAWAEGLALLLNDPVMALERAQRARIRAEAEFAAALVLPRHAALASAVAAGQV